MRTHLKHHWPLAAALIVFAMISAVILAISLSRTDGRLVYSLDDPYIHMAMAKNFVQHGVWGVTRYEFTSSTSSPLWTLLISGAYLIMGPSDIIPLVFNLVFGMLLVAALYWILSRYTSSQRYIFAIMLGIAALTALPTIVMTGQEHVLQALVSSAFVYLAAMELSKPKPGASAGGVAWLAALAPLVTAVRYEGLFLILSVCILFLVRRRRQEALVIGLLGVMPVLLYGQICRIYGWPWLPASVILKGTPWEFGSASAALKSLVLAYLRLFENEGLLHLVISALVVFILRFRRASVWSAAQCMLIITAAAAFCHLQLAPAGTFSRYEASILAVGLLALGVSLLEYLSEDKPMPETRTGFAPRNAALAVLVLLLASPYIGRSAAAMLQSPQSSANIYEQHYQVASFLRQYYQGYVVAANDIGAINYYADIKCLDLIGLGTLDTVKLTQQGAPGRAAILALTAVKKAKIAVIYDEWFSGMIPPTWTKVGEWKIKDPRSAGSDVVSFYALDPSEIPGLIANLREFAPGLPETVEDRGEYTR